MTCRWRTRLVVVSTALAIALPARVSAQAYGSQYPLGFQFIGQSDATRLAIESTRQSLSGQASGSGGGSGSVGASNSLGQSGSDLNNAVQYYNYATTTVTVTGSSNTITTGGVLNATQTSSGTNQVLNNQTNSATSTTSGVLQK